MKVWDWGISWMPSLDPSLKSAQDKNGFIHRDMEQSQTVLLYKALFSSRKKTLRRYQTPVLVPFSQLMAGAPGKERTLGDTGRWQGWQPLEADTIASLRLSISSVPYNLASL
jgi:hypothetical protein